MFINVLKNGKSSDEEDEEPDTGFLQIISGEENGEKGGQNSITYEPNALLEYNGTGLMNLELDSLDMIVRQLKLGKPDTLKATVMEHLRDLDFDTIHWATKVLLEVRKKKDKKMKAMDGLDPNLLEFFGLGWKTYSKWKMDPIISLTCPSRKKGSRWIQLFIARGRFRNTGGIRSFIRHCHRSKNSKLRPFPTAYHRQKHLSSNN